MIDVFRNYPPSYVKKLAAWNDRYITDPITVVLTEILAPLRWLSPSSVTLIAFAFSLVACFYFLDGTRVGLLWGAALWEVNYLLDGVDGKLARKRTEFAPYGAKLDNMLDKVKKAMALAALLWVEQDNQLAMLAALVCHYALLRLPARKSEQLVAWFHQHGARATLDPLDLVFLLLFVAPLMGLVYQMVLVVVGLQLLDRAIHFFAARLYHKTTVARS